MLIDLGAPEPKPFVRYVDVGDGGEPVAVHYSWRLDVVHDQLLQCRTPGEAQDVWWGLHRSLMHAVKVNRIQSGRVGSLYDALRMCDRRYHELAMALDAHGQGAPGATGHNGRL